MWRDLFSFGGRLWGLLADTQQKSHFGVSRDIGAPLARIVSLEVVHNTGLLIHADDARRFIGAEELHL